MALNKEVYIKKVTSGSIAAGAYAFFDYQTEADKSDYLPHNKLRFFNKSSCEVWVWLNGLDSTTKPDYILPSGSGLDESVLEGVNYNMLVVKNNDGAVSVNANELIIRMATVREN